MIKKISKESKQILKDIHLDKLFQQKEKLRIAVTGLSRSGKTVFITSLINQLISGKGLEHLNKDFIVRINCSNNSSFPQFPYKTILQNGRKNNPVWPKSTNTISKIELEIEIKRNSDFFPNKILTLEIVDYPGEWLLDLPLASLSFEDWSINVLNDITSSIKTTYADNWQKELNKHDIYGFTDGSQDQIIVQEYYKYLSKLRKNGFSIIQPGRYIQPGDLKDSSILFFTPLLKSKFMTPHQESIYNRFKQRYNRYSNNIVKKITSEYFKDFDRQIILIDVLKTLQNGYDSFIDMTRAIKILMEIYDYGSQSILKKWIGVTKIDKVIFSATKGDYVAINQQENFKKLLDSIIKESMKELNIKNIETETEIIASVKSTENVTKEYNGKNLSCLKGKLVGADNESIEYQGEVPSSFPLKENWDKSLFKFNDFAPTPFPDRDSDNIPNINMNRIIEKLIGDKL
jgi:predicted YcjX-like family ATPase